MSTCPENDIHSVYLDGELPEEFLQEYEAHVASCPECSKKLETLTRLKGFFHEDSASIVFSQKNLDDSFARLQAKMSYNNFKKNESENTVRFLRFKGIQYFAAGIAAAAAIVFVVPLRTSKKEVARQVFAPVARTSVSNVVNPLRIDGNLDTERLSSFFDSGTAVEKSHAVPVSSRGTNAVQEMMFEPYMRKRSSVVHPALSDYDLFTPVEVSEENSADHSKGFSFSVSSPIFTVSFEVGK